MIRINLLPREEKGHRQTSFDFKLGELVLPVLLIIGAGAVIAGTSFSQRMSITSLSRSIEDVDAKSRALAPQIARVNRLAQERAELDLRLGVISKLEKGRTLSVRLMDELARCVPDHLWLNGATQETSGSISLEGVTFSNLVVSDFMSRLERSAMFSDVELEVAERTELSDHNVVKFHISCKVTPDEPAN
ncbi:MAG: PilN domain-containing protein [Candidatus Eisenbacteria bacterium]|uniref:PilN domain-containing protein n=1 Tax=Eiseniibacteriota bacterium TaxID=2212470 RepID=A0A538SA19_UNCEI|nr:MAG: PilN domain-containing protein [Candidatus Eisenbacteria bacterium]